MLLYTTKKAAKLFSLIKIMLKRKKDLQTLSDGISQPIQDDEYILPLITVRGAVFGSEVNTSFDFGKTNSIKAVEHSSKTSNIAAIAMLKNSDDKATIEELSKICCLADVRDITKLAQDVLRVNVFGMQRVKILSIISEEPFMLVKVKLAEEADTDDERLRLTAKIAQEKYINLLHLQGNYEETYYEHLNTSDPGRICDLIMAYVPVSPADYFDVMESHDLTERLEKTIAFLTKSSNTAEIENELESKLMLQFTTDQRSRYLREKKNLISKELKDDDEDEELDEYREKLEALPLTEEYKTRLMKEMYRLEMTPPGSQEAAVIQSYLDCILDLPWNTATDDSFDVAEAVKILNDEHYGLEKIKDRIIEYIAVMKRTKSLKSPILCLVGPPGVGKTSVAKSIANATGRKFVRISLGGMHDEAEIRGHRKTYVGAMPGRIIAGLRQVQSKNPVFLLDEIDKLARDMKGDPASALLEALDPEQNSTFTDTYVEIPFNLSEVMFITTANTVSTIPAPLLDRLEVIELNGYMAYEKLEIAKKHLIPKQLAANGISEENLKLSDDVIYELIDKYTRETGVRQLERSIASLCRKATKRLIVDNENETHVSTENITDFLGKHVHTYDIAKDESLKGVVNGLAWTSSGGDTLTIESNQSAGSGKMELTGNLGDVMKESAKTAVSYIRSNASDCGLSDIDWNKIDLHLHVPEGAVPKDGPSAGITIACSIYSTLSGKPVSQKTAMTGEITLTGRVLPIGGLREKLLAADRASVKKIIIPKENEIDLKEIPDEILSGLEICFAETVNDVFRYVFGDDNDNKII